MHERSSRRKPGHVDPDPAAGAFDALLRDIENEPVPERLLELARKLQAVLVEQRRLREGGQGPAGR